MLKPYHPDHFPWMKSLIIEGAGTGVYDRSLRLPNAEIAFFRGLQIGLRTGHVHGPDGRSELLHAHLFYANENSKKPCGFALFKGEEQSQMVEFWMASISPGYRRRGFGFQLFKEALNLYGNRIIIARCNKGSDVAIRMLANLRFIHVGTGNSEGTVFLTSPNTPQKLFDEMKRLFAA
ncbi:GNAT family N-acetyltransferase [Sinimarinibacterium flocculans]|uniref:N-acetyltransferase domain-containing protein n=1 Tax=Sinimarinibacterium flocculans TaxID=985250 RepID=A0A318E4G3_9GAMM|nr:GNAT family N-acetyltransferase [Sinimarinibacterium flocculans]MEC9362933.1 GNAT family N-acetyltransferase [Pseudomonadota bacterium]PXV66037.1 hypothetical protein C8D93_1089 [Sinimarinibacterium flocculans]